MLLTAFLALCPFKFKSISPLVGGAVVGFLNNSSDGHLFLLFTLCSDGRVCVCRLKARSINVPLGAAPTTAASLLTRPAGQLLLMAAAFIKLASPTAKSPRDSAADSNPSFVYYHRLPPKAAKSKPNPLVLCERLPKLLFLLPLKGFVVAAAALQVPVYSLALFGKLVLDWSLAIV